MAAFHVASLASRSAIALGNASSGGGTRTCVMSFVVFPIGPQSKQNRTEHMLRARPLKFCSQPVKLVTLGNIRIVLGVRETKTPENDGGLTILRLGGRHVVLSDVPGQA